MKAFVSAGTWYGFLKGGFALAVLLGSALFIYSQGDPPSPAPGTLEQIIAAQQALPEPARRAMQDLRLFAAVQANAFGSSGRYPDASELKEAGFLDPRWPRTDPAAYRIHCAEDTERLGFTCFADPLLPHTTYFRIDATQVLRYAEHRRPDGGSPIFGLHQEAP